MSRSQILKLEDMIKENPKIFATADILKQNRSMSYLTFVLKDIKEYVIQKTDDGVYYEEIRTAKRKITGQ